MSLDVATPQAKHVAFPTTSAHTAHGVRTATLDRAPYAAAPTTTTEHDSKTGRIVANQKTARNTTPEAEFDEISRKLTAGPLTLEYLVSYAIEAYSKR
ncbi:hypothetical protein ACFSYH_11055 [Populibacterium corticicola]|uniref:Flagellar biosynthesis anti-sigma factor FlgM n=1 Tax=Populibacterium corticicola TaxID=1812826 RepID=A0ABW5XGT7_9MICO